VAAGMGENAKEEGSKSENGTPVVLRNISVSTWVHQPSWPHVFFAV